MGRLRPAHISIRPTRIWISIQLQMDGRHNQVLSLNRPLTNQNKSPSQIFTMHPDPASCIAHEIQMWVPRLGQKIRITFLLLLYFTTGVFQCYITPQDHSLGRTHETTHSATLIHMSRARVGFGSQPRQLGFSPARPRHEIIRAVLCCAAYNPTHMPLLN